MRKLEEMLKNNKYNEYEEHLLFRINQEYKELEKYKKMIDCGEWGTREEMDFLSKIRDDYEKQQISYEELYPVSTVTFVDSQVTSKYKEIQKVDTTSYYHGIEHIRNVLIIMSKFISALGIDSKTADKLFTAVVFHDIGRSNVGKGHEKKSAAYFQDYMRNPLNHELIYSSFEKEDIDEIISAILKHETKENLESLTSFELLVNLADKLDITKNRINMNNPLNPELPSYKFDIFREIYLDVDDVSIKKVDDILVIDIVGNKDLSRDRLLSIPFVTNMQNVLAAFAKSVGCDYVLSVNGDLSKKTKHTKM